VLLLLRNKSMQRRQLGHFVLGSTIALTASLFVAAAAAQPARRFDVQGHRGARGMLPENTLQAFTYALENDCTTLELDIGLSADNVVVISHDPLLNPDFTRNEGGLYIIERTPIRSLTFAQLQTFDVGRIKRGSAYSIQFANQSPVDGAKIPSLEQLFQMVKERKQDSVRFNIETKVNPLRPDDTATPEQMVNALLRVIGAQGMASRCTIQSFDWRTLQLVQRLAPQIPTAYLTVQNSVPNNLGDVMKGTASPWTAEFAAQSGESLPALIKRAGGRIWSPQFRDVTADLVKEAKQLGLQVIPWTVNTPEDIAKIRAMGVDGLITDYPGLFSSRS
jgi:glycerophosphoryl diester phosphodiesterase